MLEEEQDKGNAEVAVALRWWLDGSGKDRQQRTIRLFLLSHVRSVDSMII